MSIAENVIEGTLQPDGTLVLDEKPNLPAGRVRVTLRPGQIEPNQSLQLAYLRTMGEIRADQRGRGHVAQIEAEDAERRTVQSEMDDEIEAAIRLQEECRRQRSRSELDSKLP